MHIFKKTIGQKKFLNILLFLIAFFSILAAIDPSGRSSYLLTLSKEGFEQKYFWQLLTYIFLLPHPSVSVGFILRLAINLYIFWFCASFIINWKGSRQLFFYLLFLILFCAFSALFFMSLSPFFLFGLNILICAIAVAWLMLNGNVRLHMTALHWEVQAKWLVVNLILLRIIYNLFLSAYFTALLDLAGVIFTYFYALIIWQHSGPFIALHRFEEPLTKLFKRQPK